MYLGLLLLQKNDFKPVFSAWVKVRKNDFCIGLTGEQQMCRHWASLIFVNEDEHVGQDHENDDLMTMVISLMIMINLTVLECSINEWKWFFLVLAAACGGTLTATSGNITSPSYPENYPKNKRCLWKISGPKGQTVSFQFHEFQLEGAANGVSLSVWLMNMISLHCFANMSCAVWIDVLRKLIFIERNIILIAITSIVSHIFLVQVRPGRLSQPCTL